MKVAINGLIIDNYKAGIGHYGYNIINSLIKLNNVDITLFLQPIVDIHHDSVVKTRNYKKSYERILDEQLFLPSKYKQYDIVHFIDYSSPIVNINKSFILTIHDLSFIKYPETFSIFSRVLKQFLAPIGIKRARYIIADSVNTKNDILELFPNLDDKIKVIYPGKPNYKRVSADEIYRIRRKYCIYSEYVLCVCTLEPRKNLKRLVQAFNIVNSKMKSVKLVMTGKKGWLMEELLSDLRLDQLKDNIIFTGYVPQEDIAALYSGAEVFCYPSLYEGFGLPPLESMCCGTPVVVSNTSSLPEVVGNAGLYINPHEVESIADGILKVLCDSALRKELTEKGYSQANEFSWDKCAKEIVDLYQNILDRGIK